jgi:16S rRNA processing protein RimM
MDEARDATGGPEDGFIVVAEVVKAVGLRGEIKLYPLVDWHEPLLDSGFLRWSGGASFEVITARPSGECTVVLCEGCRSREEAEARVGDLVGFRREDYLAESFPRPPEGLPFAFLDREVVLAGGERVGVVGEVRRFGPRMLLVIEREGREVLIPAQEPFLGPEAGLEGPLVIDPPEGLLDVAGD